MSKEFGAVQVELTEVNGGSDKVGTVTDQLDMDRVGKTPVLRRNFRLVSILGFTAVLMCTWEAILLYVHATVPTDEDLLLTLPIAPPAIFCPMAGWPAWSGCTSSL